MFQKTDSSLMVHTSHTGPSYRGLASMATYSDSLSLKLKGTPEFTTCNHLHISNIRAQAEMFGYHLGFSKTKSFMFVFFTSLLLLLEPTSPVQLGLWQAWNAALELAHHAEGNWCLGLTSSPE